MPAWDDTVVDDGSILHGPHAGVLAHLHLIENHERWTYPNNHDPDRL